MRGFGMPKRTQSARTVSTCPVEYKQWLHLSTDLRPVVKIVPIMKISLSCMSTVSGVPLHAGGEHVLQLPPWIARTKHDMTTLTMNVKRHDRASHA